MNYIGEINYSPNLTLKEKIVIEGRHLPMIKDVSVSEVQKTVIKIIGNIVSIKGLKDIPKATIDFIIDFVSKTLKESFGTYRLSDIQQACEMWAIGDLFSDKDLNQLSAENIFKAIHRFNERVRKEANHKQGIHEFNLQKEVVYTDREKKIVAFEREIAEAYIYFQNNLEMPLLDYIPIHRRGVHAAYYRHLCKTRGYILSDELLKTIYEQAREVLNKEKEGKVDLRFYNDTEKLLNQDKKEAQIKEIAESISIEYLFAEYIKNEINLNEILL